jgi:hypothetical protein
MWTVADAERLAESGLAPQLLRVCIEPVELKAEEALAFVEEITSPLTAAASPRRACNMEMGTQPGSFFGMRCAAR